MSRRAAVTVFAIVATAFAVLSSRKSNLTLSVAASAEPRTASDQASSNVKQLAVAPPPLGWSSWNSFSNTIDSQIVQQQARAMVSNGMQKAGYQYVNIDEGWWLGQRDANGHFVIDPKAWPALQTGERDGDMSNIARFVHSLGLKAGIYTDAGASGCGTYYPDIGPPTPNTGSEGHYDQDFLQFAQWGFDYVKVDWCGGDKEKLDPAVQYAAIAHAILRAEKITGHRVYFSICNWGNNSPWTWAPGIGGVSADIWRTSGDIVAPIVANSPNSARVATYKGMLANFDQGIHPEAQHTGFYNDPDMMVLGMPGLSEAQNRAHMGLWAISGAPLLVGADLTKLGPVNLATLTNPAALAIDQDSLGLQAVKVDETTPGLQVWNKLLAEPGARAVLLLNRNSVAAEIIVRWSDVGLNPSAKAEVKDVWTGKELGSFSSSYSAQVPAGDAVFLLVRGAEARWTRYEAASSENNINGESNKSWASGRSVSIGGDKSLTFKIAPIQRPTFVQIHYLNPGRTARIGQLRVDGGVPINVLFPASGTAAEVGSITVEVELRQPTQPGMLEFSSAATGLALESVSVLQAGH